MYRKIEPVKIAATYMGAVIGAAFASGQEIQQFFVAYGQKGFLGVFLAMILFCFFGALVLYISERIQAKSYYDLLEFMFDRRITKLFDLLIALILLAGLGIMMSASGALLKQQFGLPNNLGIFIMALIVAVVMWGGIRWIYAINLILIPLKIIITIGISLYILSVRGIEWSVPLTLAPKVTGNFVLASILYVSYNMLLTAVVLCTIYIPGQKKANIRGGIAGGIGLGILAFIIATVCFSFYPDSMFYQVPMVYIASFCGPIIQHIYAFVIWMAILTAAVSSSYGFAKRVAQKTGWSYRIIGSLSVIIVLPLVRLSFMSLVSSVYPLFGYFGIIILLGLLTIPFKRKRGNTFTKF